MQHAHRVEQQLFRVPLPRWIQQDSQLNNKTDTRCVYLWKSPFFWWWSVYCFWYFYAYSYVLPAYFTNRTKPNQTEDIKKYKVEGIWKEVKKTCFPSKIFLSLGSFSLSFGLMVFLKVTFFLSSAYETGEIQNTRQWTCMLNCVMCAKSSTPAYSMPNSDLCDIPHSRVWGFVWNPPFPHIAW